MKAIKDIDCYYLIMGDGKYHEYLKNLAARIGCGNKVEFVKSIPNNRLCGMLREFDIMVSHCDYWGIPKLILEAALAGLPIIMNKHPIEPISEYEENWLALCDNTPRGYEKAIAEFFENGNIRYEYGQRAHGYAMKNFNPALMENKVADIYKEIIGRHSN